MNAIDQLNAYLQAIERRLRLMAISRGAAIAGGCALVMTVALVLITNSFAFSSTSMLWARILLFLSLAVAVGFGLVMPLLRMNRRNAASAAEAKFTDFKERLLTVTDKSTKPDPFVQLLAADTMNIARNSQPEKVAPTAWIAGLIGSAGVAVAVLLWLGLAGPGFLGYGTSLLWAGTPKTGLAAFYDITVQPGNKTVRRKSDQMITAHLVGFNTDKVRLFAQYRGTSKWEQVNMTPQPEGNGYEFLFGGLAETVDYFVEAGPVQSKHFTLKAIDLPGVKKIRVTYHYPKWSGMQDVVEDPGGDLRAVEGTEAEVAVETDRPLAKGALVLGDDNQIALEGSGNTLTARVPILKDGMYHVAAIESGESVRLSEDYFIEARKDDPPTVKITKPGRDAKVSPIEEVTVAVEGADDFGLQELSLRYAVNGGPEKSVSFLNQKGAKSSNGAHVVALEDYKLSPGDLVSMYAVARDAQHTTKTDIFFLEAQPYERDYSQSQQAGGSGGGQQEDRISERQKEIIAATWNEQKGAQKDAIEAREDARFLSETQGKLGEQAKSLAERMRTRQLTGGNQEFQTFAQEMEQASAEMGNATGSLKGQKWTDAMPHEQKALQHLLRAEAVFRDIQVAFGTQGGGGGGGGGMGRDLENLFDLELDTEKNQYETGQQSPQDKKQQEVDKALDKLKELAQRQQELAAQAQKEQTFRQRWEQEMLRREAEELKRQMEQLQRGDSQQQNSQSQQGQKGQQGQQGQQGQEGQQGQQGQQGQSPSSSANGSQSSGGPQSPQERMSAARRQQASNDPRLQEAIQRLKQATDDMRQAQSSQQGGKPEQNAAGQRRAADRLNEAKDLLGGMRQQEASQAMDDMVHQAEQLAAHQQDFQSRLRQQSGQGGSREQAQRLASEKDKMSDDLKQLERQMSDTSRQIREEQPGVSTKLREALAESQQNEIGLKMKKNADFIRQGQGSVAWMREQPVTQGLEQLKESLKGAQASLQGKGPGKNGQDKGDAERALAQVEAARSRLEQATQGRGNQRGQQQGKQPGQTGQPGQQPGQGREGQASEQQDGGQQPGQLGRQGTQTGDTGGGPFGGYGPAASVNEAIRDLSQARQRLQSSDPDASKEALRLLQQLQGLNLANANDKELADRIAREVLPELQRLELQLRRELDEKNAGQVRTGGTDQVPTGYADTVAEYFRKLSKGK